MAEDSEACIFCKAPLASTAVRCARCGAYAEERDGERVWRPKDRPARSVAPSGTEIGGWVAAIAVVVVIFAALALSGDDDDGGGGASTGPDPEKQQYAAFDVCQEFVKRQLRAPATAKFRNFFEDDGEVVVTTADAVRYVVRSSVDSENGFGALIRSRFTCTVSHVAGDEWRLVDLDVS